MATPLSDGDGTLLSLVQRAQPVTVYEISKIYASSPVTNFGTSKGKLYPMVRRLKAAGFLIGEHANEDKRGTELLSCTEKGLDALKHWAQRVDDVHLLLDDPLRTRLQSLHLLERHEQVQWLENVIAGLEAKAREVEDYIENVEVSQADLVIDNVRLSMKARLKWARAALQKLRDSQPDRQPPQTQ